MKQVLQRRGLVRIKLPEDERCRTTALHSRYLQMYKPNNYIKGGGTAEEGDTLLPEFQQMILSGFKSRKRIYLAAYYHQTYNLLINYSALGGVDVLLHLHGKIDKLWVYTYFFAPCLSVHIQILFL